MNILHTVQRYHPDTGGSEEVVKQLSERLVQMGHQVTVATGVSPHRDFSELHGVRIREFDCKGNSVEGIHGDAQAYRQFLMETDVDIMMNYAAQIWSTDLVYELLPSLKMKKVLVPCGYSRLHDPRFKEYFQNMPDILRLYDKAVYLSHYYIDKTFGDIHGLTNGIVIPNGADMDEFTMAEKGSFRRKYDVDDRCLIMNVSNHGIMKHHAFFWNCISKFSRKKVFPVLVGNSYVSFAKKWFSECYTNCMLNGLRYQAPILEGVPRADVADVYVDADIFLFGSKVECSPLVMFEAFASKTLFITTDCGNVSDYKDIVCIVNNEAEACSLIEKYIKHPGQFDDRIQRGYEMASRSLNWDVIAREYASMYSSL